MAVTGQCTYTAAQPTTADAQCSCGFKNGGKTEADCYNNINFAQYCDGDSSATDADSCAKATCYNWVPSSCAAPQVSSGTTKAGDYNQVNMDKWNCSDQPNCAVFTPSYCTNGVSGGTADDCPPCYAFTAAKCMNHNPEAEARGDTTSPFEVNGATTEEECAAVADACIHTEAACMAESSTATFQQVAANDEATCDAYTGGCTWHRAYTFEEPCEFTPESTASMGFCSDSVDAAMRSAMHGASGHSASKFGVSTATLERAKTADASYTGSCNNGIKDGNEAGVDCGGNHYGTDCAACPTEPPTTTQPPTTTTKAATTQAPTTAAPTEGPVEVAPAGTISTSLLTVVLLALSAVFML
jgi:hypothetical protein